MNKRLIVRGTLFCATHVNVVQSINSPCIVAEFIFPFLLYAGPGTHGEEDFEGFIEYANRVEMDEDDYRRLERVVEKYLPRKPLYVCTIKKSNIVKGKAKMVNILYILFI
jgi:hypothetical protein